MASADKVPMLPEGHRQLTDEVRHLKTVERLQIIEAIEAARAHGDAFTAPAITGDDDCLARQ